MPSPIPFQGSFSESLSQGKDRIRKITASAAVRVENLTSILSERVVSELSRLDSFKLKSPDLRSTPDWIRRSIRLSSCLIIFGLLGHALILQGASSHIVDEIKKASNWAAITCVVVSSPLIGKVAEVSVLRVIGTALGAFVSFSFFTLGINTMSYYWTSNLIALASPLIVVPSIYMAFKTSLDQLAKFLMLTYVIVGYSATPGNSSALQLAIVRTVGIISGGLLSLVLAVIILPRSASIESCRELKTALKMLAQLNSAVWQQSSIPASEGLRKKGRSYDTLSMLGSLRELAGDSEADSGSLKTTKVAHVEALFARLYSSLDKIEEMMPCTKGEIYIHHLWGRYFFLPGIYFWPAGRWHLPCEEMTALITIMRRVARLLWTLLLDFDEGFDEAMKGCLQSNYPKHLMAELYCYTQRSLNDLHSTFPNQRLINIDNLLNLGQVVDCLIQISDSQNQRAAFELRREAKQKAARRQSMGTSPYADKSDLRGSGSTASLGAWGAGTEEHIPQARSGSFSNAKKTSVPTISEEEAFDEDTDENQHLLQTMQPSSSAEPPTPKLGRLNSLPVFPVSPLQASSSFGRQSDPDPRLGRGQNSKRHNASGSTSNSRFAPALPGSGGLGAAFVTRALSGTAVLMDLPPRMLLRAESNALSLGKIEEETDFSDTLHSVPPSSSPRQNAASSPRLQRTGSMPARHWSANGMVEKSGPQFGRSASITRGPGLASIPSGGQLTDMDSPSSPKLREVEMTVTEVAYSHTRSYDGRPDITTAALTRMDSVSLGDVLMSAGTHQMFGSEGGASHHCGSEEFAALKSEKNSLSGTSQRILPELSEQSYCHGEAEHSVASSCNLVPYQSGELDAPAAHQASSSARLHLDSATAYQRHPSHGGYQSGHQGAAAASGYIWGHQGALGYQGGAHEGPSLSAADQLPDSALASTLGLCSAAGLIAVGISHPQPGVDSGIGSGAPTSRASSIPQPEGHQPGGELVGQMTLTAQMEILDVVAMNAVGGANFEDAVLSRQGSEGTGSISLCTAVGISALSALPHPGNSALGMRDDFLGNMLAGATRQLAPADAQEDELVADLMSQSFGSAAASTFATEARNLGENMSFGQVPDLLHSTGNPEPRRKSSGSVHIAPDWAHDASSDDETTPPVVPPSKESSEGWPSRIVRAALGPSGLSSASGIPSISQPLSIPGQGLGEVGSSSSLVHGGGPGSVASSPGSSKHTLFKRQDQQPPSPKLYADLPAHLPAQDIYLSPFVAQSSGAIGEGSLGEESSREIGFSTPWGTVNSTLPPSYSQAMVLESYDLALTKFGPIEAAALCPTSEKAPLLGGRIPSTEPNAHSHQMHSRGPSALGFNPPPPPPSYAMALDLDRASTMDLHRHHLDPPMGSNKGLDDVGASWTIDMDDRASKGSIAGSTAAAIPTSDMKRAMSTRLESMMLDVGLTRGDSIAMAFPDTAMGHVSQMKWFSFQFILDELVEELEAAFVAAARILNKIPHPIH